MLKRNFEAFYNTKSIDKGEGMVLSMVYKFIKQIDGCVIVESTVGEGIYFTLLYLVQADLALIEAPQIQILTEHLAIQCR